MEKELNLRHEIETLDCIPDTIKQAALSKVEEIKEYLGEYYEDMFIMNLEVELDALDFTLDDYEKEFTLSQFRQLLVAAIFYTIVDCHTGSCDFTFGQFEDEYYVFDLYGGKIIEAIHVFETEDENYDDALVPPYDYKCYYEDMCVHYLRKKDHPFAMN